jgi:hypothetical protein
MGRAATMSVADARICAGASDMTKRTNVVLVFVCHTCLKKPLSNFLSKKWKLMKIMDSTSNHLLRIFFHSQ